MSIDLSRTKRPLLGGDQDGFLESIFFSQEDIEKQDSSFVEQDSTPINQRLQETYQRAQGQLQTEASKEDFKFYHLWAGFLHRIQEIALYVLGYSNSDFSYTAEKKTVGGLPVGICHSSGGESTAKHLATAFSIKIGERVEKVQLFGVFDGHNGKAAAKHSKDNLERKLKEKLKECNADELTDAGIEKALKQAVLELDQEFKLSYGEDPSGTTATIAMILGDKLWVANVGDSRATLIDPSSQTVNGLTEDAKVCEAAKNSGHPLHKYFEEVEERKGTIQGELIVKSWDSPQKVPAARSIGDVGFGTRAWADVTAVPLKQIQNNSFLVLTTQRIHRKGGHTIAGSKQIGEAILGRKGCFVKTLAKDIVYSSFRNGPEQERNLSAMVIKLSPKMNFGLEHFRRDCSSLFRSSCQKFNGVLSKCRMPRRNGSFSSDDSS